MTKSMKKVLLAGFFADAVSAQPREAEEPEVCEINGETFPFPAVTEVDVEAYLGTWYQPYASNSVINSFEFGGNCVTAEYGTFENRDDAISVKNIVRPQNPFYIPWLRGPGPRLIDIPISGYALQNPDDDLQGELQVIFFQGSNKEFKEPGNYWIIELGDKKQYRDTTNVGDLYSYAVVSNEDGSDLYILARDPKDFVDEKGKETKLAKEVLAGKVSCFTKGSNQARITNQRRCGNGYYPEPLEPSCESFEVTAQNVVNWRQAASQSCVSCLANELKKETIEDPSYGYSVAQTGKAFSECGKDLSGIPGDLPQPLLSAFVPPQSFDACESVPVLTPDILSDWRNILTSNDFAACGSCVINRLRGGEAKWNDLGGVVEALGLCGYDKAVPDNLSVPDDFVPPGCGEFTTGETKSSPPNNDGNITFDCEACTSSWAFGTANNIAGIDGYPGTCVPQSARPDMGVAPVCTYADSAAAFNYCGSDPPWPESECWPRQLLHTIIPDQ